ERIGTMSLEDAFPHFQNLTLAFLTWDEGQALTVRRGPDRQFWAFLRHQHATRIYKVLYGSIKAYCDEKHYPLDWFNEDGEPLSELDAFRDTLDEFIRYFPGDDGMDEYRRRALGVNYHMRDVLGIRYISDAAPEEREDKGGKDPTATGLQYREEDTIPL